MRYLKLYLLSALALFFLACSDDDDGTEFKFDREIYEYSIIEGCGPGAPEDSICYKIRYHYPIRTEDYSGLCVWLDDAVIDDTSKSVSNKQIEKAHDNIDNSFFRKYQKKSSEYDTLDLTESIAKFVKMGYDSLQVVMFCEYSDGGDPGSVQRVFLPFKDVLPPTDVEPLSDSLWATGAWFEWYRPTDRTKVLSPNDVSGKILGYNVVIYSNDPDEDVGKLEVTIQSPAGVDNKGTRLYKRNAYIHKRNDSVLVDAIKVNEKNKNYLRLVVYDGEGYNSEDISKNHFRLIVDGLRTQSGEDDPGYRIAISSWDMVGNASGSEINSSVDFWRQFNTTDSIAPLMARKIFTAEDSLFPGYTKLDSNNRVGILWSRSVDPLKFDHGIEVDSVLVFPRGCNENTCYKNVSNYEIEYYDKLDKSWHKYSSNKEKNYTDRYSMDEKGRFSMDYSGTGRFVSDTIQYVAPGDTLILRIRSIDNSEYKSAALVDTIFVSPGELADKLKCPKGFIAVSTSDTTSLCMEKFEHRGADGKFMTNVLHSEAAAACEAMSASGFEISLCRERDWELVCLSGGSLQYGVVEESDSKASDYLFKVCNVSTNDSTIAADIRKRDPHCMNPMGVRDLPGQYQEWVMGRSEDTAAVLKGASYMVYEGLDRESIAYCTNRAFPYYTRPGYTQDTVYLYREGTLVDTVYAADTTRNLHKKITPKDFKDTIQFYDVVDKNGKVISKDFSLYSEYKKGGKAWLDSLGNGLTYKPTKKEAVFLTGEKSYYRQAASFYKSPTIGFRCCAYKK